MTSLSISLTNIVPKVKLIFLNVYTYIFMNPVS